MFLLPRGYIGLAPIGPDLVNVSLVTKTTHRVAAPGQPTLWLEQAIQGHAELRQRFAQARCVKPLLVTGPMAQRTECPAHDGILFVGDAAGFFDPFTGQGIYLALHGAVLAATAAQHALDSGDVSAQRLRGYYHAHRLAFDDKYRFSQFIQLGLRVPWLANHVIERFAQRPRLADTVVSVAGDVLSPKTALSWHFALRMLV
jgi:flavin-dependent dehydrogenase